MSINKKLKWLYGLNKKEIKLGLNRVKKLAKALNNPQDNFQTIHIAGTNGKGSTAKLIYTILKEQGYKVGLYTSPHLVNFNERIIINDKEIKNKEIIRLISKIKKVNDINATFFEFTTFMAFLYFAEKKVDIAVIETGMGGRLDATNIIKPLASVITKISLEHEKYLGRTINKIAFEKAGIIKKGIPIITSNKGEVLKVIKKTCKKKNSKLFTIKNIKIKKKDSNLQFQKAKFIFNKEEYNIKTKLLGEHQLENIATAIMTIRIINKKLKISKSSIEKGINNCYWPARLEIIKKSPLIILDVSHNPNGFKTLRKFIKQYIKSKFKKIILIIGISTDKNKKQMIPKIVKLCNKIILCKAEYRGTDTKELKNIVKEYNKNVYEIENIKEAVYKTLKEANKKDAIIITGSIFVAGEVKKIWKL